MTAHELARKLLEGPDLPVGYHSEESPDGGEEENKPTKEVTTVEWWVVVGDREMVVLS